MVVASFHSLQQVFGWHSASFLHSVNSHCHLLLSFLVFLLLVSPSSLYVLSALVIFEDRYLHLSSLLPKQEILLKIAEYFGVTTDYLLTGEERPTEPELQLEGVEYALFGEVRDMTEAQKRDVLKFAKFLKQKGD